jgi:hypothetical protein
MGYNQKVVLTGSFTMASPFPGMDPYLEDPAVWSEFHHRLIMSISNDLTPKLRPRYYVGIETRTYSEDPIEGLQVGIPDAVILSAPAKAAPVSPFSESSSVATSARPEQVMLPIPIEVRERYLEVREVGTDAVVTAIEVLSPTNKRSGKGRDAYLKKRREVLASLSHLIEIDLIRASNAMPMSGSRQERLYRILVSWAQKRPTADLYSFGLQEEFPDVPLPLKSEDESLLIEFSSIFATAYDGGSYDLRIDYSQPVPPPNLSETDQVWVDELFARRSAEA